MTEMLTGVILAGGQNRRMNGQSKALLLLKGRTFLSLQLEEMSAACEELLLITQEPSLFYSELRNYEGRVRVVGDLQPGLGPLGGLQAAMTAAVGAELWVVGCDMPLLSSAAAAAMAKARRCSDADAAVARLGERLHPLHGIYHRRGLPLVESMLAEANYRFMDFIVRQRVFVAEEPFFSERGLRTDFARNVNNPDDYVRLSSEYTDLLLDK